MSEAKKNPARQGRRVERVRKLEAAFQKNYPVVQYAFIQFLSEHLADCSRMFEGDLQEMLVLAIVGQAYLDGYRRDRSECRTTSVTASSISDACGIPRQTVRRKLLRLSGKDWVEQLEDQSWRIKVADDRSVARRALRDLDRRGLLRLARLFTQLEASLP